MAGGLKQSQNLNSSFASTQIPIKMPDLKEFTDKKNVIALVGASNNKAKYGNKIFLDLKNSGYQVYPINLTEDTVEGKKCYKTLTELSKEKKIDLVITVVPPRITEQIIEECTELGIRKFWMQPGSESKHAVEMCSENAIEEIHNMCIMVEKKRR